MSAGERSSSESLNPNSERWDRLLDAQRMIDSAIGILDKLGMAVAAAHASHASEVIADELDASERSTAE